MKRENDAALDSETVMFGVFGYPVRHSRSPVMMNAAFRSLSLNAAYAAFEIKPEQLRQAVAGIRALQFRGVNVTIPHKVNVIPLLDHVDQTAKEIGAVNTIVNDQGVLTGYNTDGIGYVRSLKTETACELKGKRILMIGAGGAARGVAFALAKENPERIWIANRSVERARALAADISGLCSCESIAMEDLADIKHADVIINTTSVGMHPHIGEMPTDAAIFRSGTIVSDLIYNPLETKWLTAASQAGARIHSGLGMFIYQGAYALEYWTDREAPVSVMREAVLGSFT